MSDREYVDRSGNVWTYRPPPRDSFTRGPATQDGGNYAHWYVEERYGPLTLKSTADDLAGLRQELDEARAERDRLRPVVGAAEAYRVLLPDDPTDLPPETRGHRLAAAVDAFRSPTPDAEPAPGVPVDAEATT